MDIWKYGGMETTTTEKFIILEASAGSGKTHNLAKRYITLVLNFKPGVKNTPLKNILALTFTNKTSIEMKERIIDYLKKISLKQDTGNLLDELTVPKQNIVSNSNAVMADIFENFDNFNVKTIDSFINLIIKSSALQMGFSPNYEILKEHKKYVDFAVDAFLDNFLKDKNLENILNTFFNQFLLDKHSSWDIKGNIIKEFKTLYKENDKSISFKDSFENTDYTKTLLQYNDDFYKCCLEMSEIKEFNNINKNMLDGIKKNILPNKNYLLSKPSISSLFTKEEFPYSKNDGKNPLLDDLFEKSKKILTDFFELKAQHRYSIYIKMFKYILLELNKKTKLDSVIFLQDINKKILNIFNEDSHSVITNIYCRLSNYFKDILIDEFQDTNSIQWQTLKLLAQESLSQDGSFFYVGDKKQAIYGFRGGDSAIFDLPLKELNYTATRKILDTNYRSYKAIVEFNNSVFSQENINNFIKELLKQKKEDIKECEYKYISDTFSASKQKISEQKNKDGYLKISTIQFYDNDDKDEKTKQYLYDTLNSLKTGFEYKDITILCRSNDEISKISRWLLEKNINIQSYETLNIINNSLIKELFSILKFLNNPMDDISFYCFITSSIFLKQTKINKEVITNFFEQNRNRKTLYTIFREQFSDIWNDCIENFFNLTGFVAVYELTISLISKFNIIANFPEEANAILKFLELINEFETKQYGLQNFINYYQNFDDNFKDNNFSVKVPSSNAVKIMTIHKAKGLQFNVVIMPFLYLDFDVDNPYIKDNTFFYFTKNYLQFSKKLKNLYNSKFLKLLSDELNITYVALTRAVCEFYALIAEKENSKTKPIISLLIPENLRNAGQHVKYLPNDTKTTDATLQIKPTQLNDIVPVLSDSAVEIYNKNRNELLLKGLIIHYALSTINKFDKNNINTTIENCLKLTKLKYPAQNSDRLKNILVNLFSKKDITDLFSETGTVYNEKEFADKFGNTIRIDKLIINDKNIKLIDFKTSIYDNENIKKQIDKYLSVLKDIYPKHNIEAFVMDVTNGNLQKQ